MLDSDSIPFPLWQKVTVGPVPQHCLTYKKMRAQRRLVIQGRAPHYQHKAMRVYKLIRLRAKSLLGECETVFMRSGVADPGFLSEFFHPGSRIKKAPDPGSVQRFENSYETYPGKKTLDSESATLIRNRARICPHLCESLQYLHVCKAI
jgi:hypothetical protein